MRLWTELLEQKKVMWAGVDFVATTESPRIPQN